MKSSSSLEKCQCSNPIPVNWNGSDGHYGIFCNRCGLVAECPVVGGSSGSIGSGGSGMSHVDIAEHQNFIKKQYSSSSAKNH
ncbi:MAG: hypothetical protein M0R80_01595 [Proteobacteria bacterium]|jgi:hypothetical protein|nr:hypothetical protein [Pseudomonadota bacterium]